MIAVEEDGSMQSLRRVVPRAGRAVLLRGLLAAVALWAGAGVGRAAIVNSKHDFVTYGFSGGGACAACHIPHAAKEVRLYPREVGAVGVVDGTLLLLCKDCHKDASPALPTGGGWSTVVGAPVPPAYPHGAGYDNCTACHSHSAVDPFGPPPNDDCLTCHRSGGVAASLNIDAFFAGVGSDAASPDAAIRSQHNIYYKTDGNVSTYEPLWPAAAGGNANECKKCHGDKAEDGVALKHPSATVKTVVSGARAGKLQSAFLVYSAANGNAILPAYARNDTDKRTYEVFCLNCHRGKARSTTPASEKFGGALPGSFQAGPTLRTDPASQQGAPTPPASGWVVPPVPPKDGRLVSPFLNPDPDGTATKPWYFAYYETNGHGVANSLIQVPAAAMDRTCLSGGSNSIDGCHVPHGSKSRFLLDDTNLPFAPGIVTASQVGTGVCMAGDCHVVGVGFSLSQAGPSRTVSSFHGWWNTTPASILHDNTPLGGIGVPPAADGMALWRTYGAGNMNISASPVLTGLLPFYASGTTTEIQARTYPTALTTQWLHCLTCHDPHGTGPGTEPAMLRRYDDAMTYTSPLCGQCHVE